MTGAEILARLGVGCPEVAHLVGSGVAHIVDGVMMALLKERHLEGEDGEELGNIALDVADAPLLPRPYLGRDVVEHRDAGVAVQILGDIEIEAWIIDEDDHVGLPLHNVALAHGHVAEDGGQMQQHGHEAHVGQFAVMAHAGASDYRHQVAAEEAELGVGVVLAERLHEMAGMQIAAGFAYDKIVFHRFQLLTVSII